MLYMHMSVSGIRLYVDILVCGSSIVSQQEFAKTPYRAVSTYAALPWRHALQVHCFSFAVGAGDCHDLVMVPVVLFVLSAFVLVQSVVYTLFRTPCAPRSGAASDCYRNHVVHNVQIHSKDLLAPVAPRLGVV
jgi:hypothetical protein